MARTTPQMPSPANRTEKSASGQDYQPRPSSGTCLQCLSRRQLPLFPYFAITAHAGQGLTMQEGAIADIAIRAGDDPLDLLRCARRVENACSYFAPLPWRLSSAGKTWGEACCSEYGEEKRWTGRRSGKSISSKSRAASAGNARSYAGTAGQWKRDEASRVCQECVGKHEQSNQPSVAAAHSRLPQQMATQQDDAATRVSELQ